MKRWATIFSVRTLKRSRFCLKVNQMNLFCLITLNHDEYKGRTDEIIIIFCVAVQVDVYDEGSYTCSIQTKQQPKTSQVYLIVQGKLYPHKHQQ